MTDINIPLREFIALPYNKCLWEKVIWYSSVWYTSYFGTKSIRHQTIWASVIFGTKPIFVSVRVDFGLKTFPSQRHFIPKPLKSIYLKFLKL